MSDKPTLSELMVQAIKNETATIHRLAQENERLLKENVDYSWQVQELRDLVDDLWHELLADEVSEEKLIDLAVRVQKVRHT